LVFDSLLHCDSSYSDFAIPHKTAALVHILWVKNRLEVLVAINNAIVLAGSSLRCIKVPLDSEPNGVSRLRIVEDFAGVSDGSDMLIVL
jgi:hypothetical protein